MKTKISFLPLFLLALMIISSLQLSAQRRQAPPQGRERLEVAKTTWLSRQMSLTPEEARLFWPVYDKYEAAMQDVREDRREAFDNFGEGIENMSDAEINAMIDARIKQAEMALNARKTMIEELREFLPPRKIAIFLRAEQQFNRQLQERLMQRQGP
jgi:hypothetical protein